MGVFFLLGIISSCHGARRPLLFWHFVNRMHVNSPRGSSENEISSGIFYPIEDKCSLRGLDHKSPSSSGILEKLRAAERRSVYDYPFRDAV